MKQILTITCILISFCIYAQDYILYKGGTSMVIDDPGEDISCTTTTAAARTCNNSGQRKVVNIRDNFYRISLNNSVIRDEYDSYTISTSTAGNYYFDKRYDNHVPKSTVCTCPNSLQDFVINDFLNTLVNARDQNTSGDLSVIVVDFKSLNIPELCVNGNSINLANYLTYTDGVTISGSAAVSGFTFDPSVAGVGTTHLSATKTFDNGPKTINFSIVVNPSYTEQEPISGNMWLSTSLEFCSDDDERDLRDLVRHQPNGQQNGFVWSGGSGNIFSPIIGEGSHPITYTYTNSYNCVSEHVIVANVTDAFAITTDPLIEKCLDDETFYLSASPSGGEWKYTSNPNGHDDNEVYPPILGAGNHQFEYEVTQGYCSKNITSDIVIYALPAVNAGADLEYCNNTDNIQDLNTQLVAPLDGTWSQIIPNVSSALNTQNATVDISKLAPGVSYNLIYEYTDEKGCYNFDSREILINSTLSAPNVDDNNFVCNEGGIRLQIFAPQAGVLYKWYESESSPNEIFNGTSYDTPYLTEDKNYWISAINEFGCESARNMVTADVRPSPIITFNNDDKTQYTCLEGDVVIISGGDAYTNKRWQGTGVDSDAGIFDPSGLPSGSYNITLFATVNGCEGSGNKNVIIHEASTVSAGFPRNSCFGDSIYAMNQDASVVPTNGTWSFLDNSLNYALHEDTVDIFELQPNSSPGYELEYSVTDSLGCVSSDVAILRIYPDPEDPVVDNKTRCGNGSVVFEVLNQDNGQVYRWYSAPRTDIPEIYTGRDFPTPYLTQDTSYYVQAKTTNNCTSKFIEVNAILNPLPQVSSTANTILCLNTQVYDLNNSVSPPGGIFRDFITRDLIASNVFPNLIGEGVSAYIYEQTNVFGCTNETSFQLTITGSISDNLFIADDTSICESNPPIWLDLWTVKPGGTYTGGLAVEGGVLTPTNATSTILPIHYELEEDGCLFEDDITVTFLSSPDNPEIIGDNIGCIGDILEFSTENISNMTYNWYLDQDTAVFSSDQNINIVVGQVNTVDLEIINVIGCPSEQRATIEISSNSPTGTIVISNNDVTKGSMVSHSVNSNDDINEYYWMFGDGFTSTSAIANHYYHIPGIHDLSVIITSNIGCKDTLSIDSAINVGGSTSVPTSLPGTNINKEYNEFISGYPTITEGIVNFKYLEEKPPSVNVTVYDSYGIKRLEEVIKDDKINLHTLVKGLYFLEMKSELGIDIERIIKN